jgi:transposase-like protein
MKPDEKARRRVEMIMKARSGLCTITDAAKELGVSRKTYYEWEKKALVAMATALTDSPAGRPSTPSDSEKEALRAKLEQSERENTVLKARVRIHEVMAGNPVPQEGAGSGRTGKRTKKKRPQTVERNTKREGEGDRDGDPGVSGDDRAFIPGSMPGDASPLFDRDALAWKDVERKGADHASGPEEDGGA